MAVGFPRLRDSRDQDRSCNAFYNTALKVTHCYFCPLRPAKFSIEGDMKGVNIRRCGSLGPPLGGRLPFLRTMSEERWHVLQML